MAISDCAVPARAADGIEFIIAKDGDFIIQITPPKAPLTERPSNLQASTKRLLRFRVSKDVLKAQSTVFEDILRVQPNLVCISVTAFCIEIVERLLERLLILPDLDEYQL